MCFLHKKFLPAHTKKGYLHSEIKRFYTFSTHSLSNTYFAVVVFQFSQNTLILAHKTKCLRIQLRIVVCSGLKI